MARKKGLVPFSVGISVVLVLFLACFVVWRGQSSAIAPLPQISEDKCNWDHADVTIGELMIISDRIRIQLLDEGKNVYKELDNLDFLLPGDPGYDHRSGISVIDLLRRFTKNPRYRIGPWYVLEQNKFLSPDCLEAHTHHKDTHLVFNLFESREPASGVSRRTLYAVIPDWDCPVPMPSEKICGTGFGTAFYNAPSSFKIAPDNRHAVSEPEGFSSIGMCGLTKPDVCVKMEDGRQYLFKVLF